MSTESRDTPSPSPPPPLKHKTFRHRNFSEREWCLDEKLQYRETKNIRWKILIIRFMHEKFDSTVLPKHRSVPLRSFSVQGHKSFLTENCDTPCPRPLIHEVFPYQNPSETQKGSSTNKKRYCETKKFYRKIVLPSCLFVKHFVVGNFPKQGGEFLWR